MSKKVVVISMVAPVFAFGQLLGQSFEISNVSVVNNNRVLVSNNGKQVSYSSSLSDDKKRLTVLVKNAVLSPSIRDIRPNTVVKAVMMRQLGADANIVIELAQPSGFTAQLLPYSRSIVVDVFDWNTISNAEDNFRSGLLALENSVWGAAKEYFQKAEQEQHPDATAELGFMFLREGKSDSAISYLQKAIDRNASNGDVYGGLADANNRQGNSAVEQEFIKNFKRKHGRNPYYDEIRRQIEISVRSEIVEPESLAFSDSAKQSTEQSGDIFDQMKALQGNAPQQAAIKDSVIEIGSRNSAWKLPSWMTNIGFAISASFVLVGVFLLRGYSKWKKSELLKAAAQNFPPQPQPTDFAHLMNVASAGMPEEKAINAYQKQQSVFDKVIDDSVEDTTQEPTPETRIQATSKPAAKVTQQQKVEEESDELFDFDEEFYKEHEKKKLEHLQQKRAQVDEALLQVNQLLQQPGTSQAPLEMPTKEQAIEQFVSGEEIPVHSTKLIDDDEKERLRKEIARKMMLE